jgi:septal ring factor EnvC (AmiA/AmiB activator)
MATINTIEDLFRVLDENPRWLEALRARLLTRELLELPEKFAQFVAATEQRFDKVEQRLGNVEQRLDNVEQRLDNVEQRLGNVETAVNSLRDDLAPLKGTHARNAALREADLLAEELGFTLVRTLDQQDIRALVQAQNTTDIPANELRSFRRADLVLEATDRAGETCYLAVEVSFTANGRDTTRAVRNAGFLSRFTGTRCRAVVAGLHRDRRIQTSIESGAVSWYQLDPQALEAE